MIPFSPPRMDQVTVDEVSKVLLSGWITTGPRTKLFEEKISEYIGCRKTLCLNSATAGMELVLRWFGVKEGDEVIIPAYTYCATANVVIHCGATPVMVDVDEKDFNISLAAIREKITSKTKAIIPVDISGFPCNYDELNKLVKEEGVKNLFTPHTDEQRTLGRIMIMADAAHSVGSTYKGKKQGSITDVAVFSFHAVKNLTTAEGGAVCMNFPNRIDTDEVYKKLNTKSLHGQSKDALAKTQGNGSSWRYDVVEPGFKCNMMDIQAAIGLVELDRYDSNIARRKEIFSHYTSAFSKYDWAIIPTYKTEEKESSYHLYMIRIKGATEDQRDEIIQEIFAQEVSVNVHFQPLPLLTAYKSMGYTMSDYPVAFSNYANEISLPVYFSLSDEDLEKVSTAVINAVQKVLK
jgi:dTDP-4-amino-4,6-dideoxygalactose transaminase